MSMQAQTNGARPEEAQYLYQVVVHRARKNASHHEVLHVSEPMEFAEAVKLMEEVLSEGIGPEEEVQSIDDLDDLPEGEGWFVLSKPYWRGVSREAFANGDALPGDGNKVYLITALIHTGEGEATLYSLAPRYTPRFPVFAQEEAARLCNAIFIPYEPQEIPEEYHEGELVVEELAELEKEGAKVFGYWPWESHMLPTKVAYFANTRGLEGPLFLVVHPSAVLDEEGGTEKAIEQLLGSETLGTFVLMAISTPHVVDEEEETEETEI